MYNDAVGFKFIEYSPTLAHSKGKTLKGGKAVVCTVLKIVGILRWEIFSMETSKYHEGAVMRMGAARLSFSPRICGFNPQEIMGACKKFELCVPLY